MECSSGRKIPVICDYCGEIYYPTVHNYLKVHNKGEKDCCVHCKGNKIKQTVLQQYGVNNVMKIPKVKEKHEKTCLQKYGVKSPLENSEIYNRTKETLIEKYGVDNCGKISEVIKKRKKTMKERYGVEYPYQSFEIMEKVHQTYYQNGTCPTSKKQLQLSNLLKEIYGECLLNYPCDKISLDCLIEVEGIKIDVEYDGWYWHKNRDYQDRCRDNFVRKNGYKVLRILAYTDKLPSKEEITQAVNYLINSSKFFYKIELR